MLNTRSVTPVTSLRRCPSAATDTSPTSSSAVGSGTGRREPPTAPRPRPPLTNRVYPMLRVLYDDAGNVPPPYTSREDSSGDTQEAVQAQAATAWASDAVPWDRWRPSCRCEGSGGGGHAAGGGPAPGVGMGVGVEEGGGDVPLAGEATEVEPVIYVQACV